MNILIPHTWLLEHLETEVEPKELQRLVSLAGPSVERIYEREDDFVYDIEVTTNRVDSMSIRGIAREAAVILSQTHPQTKLKPIARTLQSMQQAAANDSTAETTPLPRIFEDDTLNNRTLCFVISDVERVATPDWMARRLKQTEMNIHDAAIDITNYVTHELGHPCHAFDYHKIMALGGEIHITTAAAGEQFITLDGAAFETLGGEVVFKSKSGEIIDLPSIKGTKNTSVDANTTHILLLAESIKPDKVRFASMSHAIRTTAAQLLEKNLDPHLADETLALALHLYSTICNAKLTSAIYDSWTLEKNTQSQGAQTPVVFPVQTVERYLGITLPIETIIHILEQLGCRVSITDNAILTVTPPTFRTDLQITADIVEEIARIYGYHTLPSTMLDTAIPITYQPNTDFELEHRVKMLLSTSGYQEAYTYSLVSEAMAAQSGYELADHARVSNPLTEDMVYLRKSLVPSLVQMITDNPTYRPLSVFEMACVYNNGAKNQPLNDTTNKKSTTIPEQPLKLALVSTGDYRDLKGMVEMLFSKLYIPSISLRSDATAHAGFSQSATMTAFFEDTQYVLGVIGIEQTQGYPAVELDWTAILTVARKNPTYQPLAKTNVIFEDSTFAFQPQTELGPILDFMRAYNPLITRVEQIDQYKLNTTVRITFHTPDRQLTTADTDPVKQALIDAVTKTYNAHIVE